MPDIDVDIREIEEEETGERSDTGTRLVLSAKDQRALVTNDVTLATVAKVHNVDTISINTVTNAFKPPVLWGDRISVSIVKEGESPGQGVGYLDDGTMVVVEMGKAS